MPTGETKRNSFGSSNPIALDQTEEAPTITDSVEKETITGERNSSPKQEGAAAEEVLVGPAAAVDSQEENEEDDDPKKKRPHSKCFFQWVPTDDDQLAKSERRMLKSISHRISQKTVAGLNTIFTLNEEHPDVHTVLVHGFAGGVANWLPTWDALSEHTSVYAIDLPGFARSYRPDVKFGSAADAIEFMTESILMWIKEMKLCGEGGKKVRLVGHSFGGYICANFAIRYPSLLEKLILTDPWGCPVGDSNRKLPFKIKVAMKLFYLINPLTVLRGPWGPAVLPKVRKDFAERWEPHLEDPNDFYDYTYHCNAASPPIGEQAFQACCTGPALAKLPLEVTIPEGLDPNVELGVIFGENSWMDFSAGARMLDGFREKGGMVADTQLRFIPDAGHQVMSDNATAYNNVLLELLDHATMM